MEEQRKYAPFAIPGRDEPAAKASVPSGSVVGASRDIQMSGESFAEIEIDFNFAKASPAERALHFFSSVTPPEPIEQRAHDPLRMRFYDMRSLATGRPFARDDSELFYRQAKFMADITDDYGGDAKFFMYFPYYQHMGYEQLRTYFTWRTKARGGEMAPTSGSYVFLYVYELLSNVGVDDPGEGLERLVAVWDTCLSFAPVLEKFMPLWFKDYHIYYGLEHSFRDFVEKHGLLAYYSLTFLFEQDFGDDLALWNNVSSYDVTKSKFYCDGNEQLIRDCFRAVLDGIGSLCRSVGQRTQDLIIYGFGNRTPWKPFKQALFFESRKQPDRVAEMPGEERYYCKNGLWTVNLPIYYSTQRDFVGYIIKKTESCLRQAAKFKYKLTAEPANRFGESFSELRKTRVRNADLEATINKAVADFQKERKRTIVTVDQGNLDRIRKEALGTQEKLTVLESASGEERLGEERLGEERLGEERGERREERVAGNLGALVVGRGVPDAAQGVWAAFGEALSKVEIMALALVLRDDADVKSFADEHGIMLEVLADSINEKAVDSVGDSILEIGDGMAIYEEYREDCRRIAEKYSC